MSNDGSGRLHDVNSELRMPAVKASEPIVPQTVEDEACAACGEPSHWGALPGAAAAVVVAVAVPTPSSGPPRNKRCSSSSSATAPRPSWPVGSIEAVEAALEEEIAARQLSPGRGIGAQHTRPHSMPESRGA